MNILTPDYPPHADLTQSDMSQVTLEIVHHSATGPDVTPLDIDAMHRNRMPPFTMIGYHFVIARDGTIYQGRPMDTVPAAAQDENWNSVDIVLIGQYEPAADGYNGPPPKEQLDALVDLSVYVHEQVPSIERTIGHHDAGLMADPPYEDQCPGADLLNYLPTLRAAIHAAQGLGTN